MVGILHDDWSVRLGEKRPDQISRTFGCYALSAFISLAKFLRMF